MLQKIYQNHIKGTIKPNLYNIYPKFEDRDFWDNIADELKSEIIAEAEKLLNYNWPIMKATDFMSYHINGSRRDYDKTFESKFNALSTLAIAECIEGKGRFLNDLINGIWNKCEETSWVHTGHLPSYNCILPKLTDDYLDLRVSSSGRQLSFIYYLLKNQLDNISPIICERIHYEVKRRVLDRYLKNDYWWMGFSNNRVNNWNTHCNDCCLTAFFILEQNPKRLKSAIDKGIRSLNIFYNHYHNDGSCDEGPGYWQGAGLVFLNIIRMFSEILNIDVKNLLTPKMEKMGSYIADMYIDENYYVSYADGTSRFNLRSASVYKMSKTINDKAVADLALHTFNKNKTLFNVLGGWILPMHEILNYITCYDDMKNNIYKYNNKRYKECSYYPDMSLMTMRENKLSPDGFFAAMKGGHNNESHNHNDIGNVWIYYNGKPVIVDAGIGEYTNKTFGSDRYKIWAVQSNYHNLPQINGVNQSDGLAFNARNGRFEHAKTYVKGSLDIEKAYPKTCNVNKWTRKIIFSKASKSKVTIRDCFSLKNASRNLIWNFITPIKPNLDGSKILFKLDECIISLSYNTGYFKTSYEFIPSANDKKYKKSWGNGIYRIQLKSDEDLKKDCLNFIFNKEQ